MAKSNRLGIDFLVVSAGQAMMVLQGVIVLPFVIKLAGEATYGAYVLVLSLVGWLFGLLGCGIPYRYQRNVVSATTFQQRKELFEPQFTFQIVVVSAIAIAAILVGRSFETWLFADAANLSIGLLNVYLFTRLFNKQALDYFQYTQRFLPFSLTLSSSPYFFVLLLAFVASIQKHLSLDTLITLQVISTGVVSFPLLLVLVREIGIPRLRLPLGLFIADAKLGLPLMLELTIDFLLRSSDRYLILAFLSLADVGKYQPAYTVGSLAIFVVTIAETILIPALSRLVDGMQRETAADLTAAFLKLFIVLGIPMVLGALITGPSVVGLLTTPAIGLSSAWVTPLIALATIFYGVARLASSVAFVLGRTMLILWANLAGAVVSLSFNLLMLPLLHDITVAAMAAVLGQLINCLYVVFALRTVWPFRLDWPTVMRSFGAAAIMFATLWVLGFRPAVVSGRGVMFVSASIGLAIATYLGVLALFGGIRRCDWDEVLRLTARRSE